MCIETDTEPPEKKTPKPENSAAPPPEKTTPKPENSAPPPPASEPNPAPSPPDNLPANLPAESSSSSSSSPSSSSSSSSYDGYPSDFMEKYQKGKISEKKYRKYCIAYCDSNGMACAYSDPSSSSSSHSSLNK